MSKNASVHVLLPDSEGERFGTQQELFQGGRS